MSHCIGPGFFKLMGKKWSYAMLCRIQSSEKYSFDEIIKFTYRQVPRASLAHFLKKLIEYGLMKKEENKYSLTEKGAAVRTECLSLGKVLIYPRKCNILDES